MDVTIQNNSNQNCNILAMYTSVNGIMVSAEVDSSNSVPVGKTLNTQISISRAAMDMASIQSINNISFIFSIENPQTYETIAESPIINIGNTDKIQDLSSLSKRLLYENDDITVNLIGTENNNKSVLVSIKNKTDSNYVFLTGGFSVNNYVMEDVPIFSGGSDSMATSYSLIFPNGTIIMRLDLIENSISTNNIKNISSYEFALYKCVE